MEFVPVELGRADEAHDRSRALTRAQRTRKEPISAANRQLPFILPMSGRRLKSTIVGIRCFVVASRFERLSSAAEVG